MRITDVRATVLRAPLAREYWGREAWKGQYTASERGESHDLTVGFPLRSRMRHRWADDLNTCLVEVDTDEGITGIGESKAVTTPDAVAAYIEDGLRSAVLGKDPFETRRHWDNMMALMRGRGHLQGFHQEAAAGVDIACWDLKGKATSRPIHALMGGRYRRALPIYYSALPGLRRSSDGKERERLGDRTQEVMSKGFTAAKIAIGFGKTADLESVELVRSVAGQNFLILVDALSVYSYADAVWMADALAELKVGWFEAPLPPEDLEGYRMLSQRSRIHIANDLIWTTGLFKEVVRSGARVVVQPEVIKVGLTECQRIAQLADIYDLPFAPHSSIGSSIQFAATFHVGVSAPNLMISEHWGSDNPLGNEILQTPLVIADSSLEVPPAPGLGISLDTDRLKQFVVESVNGYAVR